MVDIKIYCKRKISLYIDKQRVNKLTKKCKGTSQNLIIKSGVIILCPEQLTIADNVAINNDVWINAAGGISIGNYVVIGPKTIIHSANHKFDNIDIPIQKQGHDFKYTVIEDDVWLAAAVVVTPGARIGRGSVIGAGAVVVGNILPYSIAVGVPARVIKCRKK